MPDRFAEEPPLELRREMRPCPGELPLPNRWRERPGGWRPRGVGVEARESEHPNKLEARFRRMVEKEGILGDARRHEHFVPPSQRRRQKRRAAAARRAKARR